MKRKIKPILLTLLGIGLLVLFVCGGLYIFRQTDDINISFSNDLKVIGSWKSVDIVKSIDDFTTEKQNWKSNFYLEKLTFKENGELLVNDDKDRPWFKWTKGTVIHKGDKTASNYQVRSIGGTDYMFYEWKSGEYTFLHKKPSYYVLARER